ncbi:hypothetical protein BMS3Bbin04_00994 [bacterium BMS3Bbin04]|nr:hypothetical protein BMS3Bbin04_00994 [bacterium BMS3Bbin04]
MNRFFSLLNVRKIQHLDLPDHYRIIDFGAKTATLANSQGCFGSCRDNRGFFNGHGNEIIMSVYEEVQRDAQGHPVHPYGVLNHVDGMLDAQRSTVTEITQLLLIEIIATGEICQTSFHRQTVESGNARRHCITVNYVLLISDKYLRLAIFRQVIPFVSSATIGRDHVFSPDVLAKLSK